MHKTSCSTAEVGNEKNRTNPHLNSGKSISTNNPKQASWPNGYRDSSISPNLSFSIHVEYQLLHPKFGLHGHGSLSC